MSDTARDYQTIELASTEGLDDIFDLAPVPTSANLYREPVATGASLFQEPVPVELAAQIMGSSVNALKKQLRKGTVKGHKRDTKHGSKWFVEPSELPESTPVDVSNASISLEPVTTCASIEIAPVPTDAYLCQEPVTTCSEIQSEPVPTSAETDKHLNYIQELQNKLEGATYRIGYLEAQLESERAQVKLLTDSQHKGGWWAKFSSWFFKGK